MTLIITKEIDLQETPTPCHCCAIVGTDRYLLEVILLCTSALTSVLVSVVSIARLNPQETIEGFRVYISEL